MIMADFYKFISFVKRSYKASFNEELKFPKFNDITRYHQESMMRLGIEAKFFDIVDDIDSIVMLSHLIYLHHNDTIINIKQLYENYINDDADIMGGFNKHSPIIQKQSFIEMLSSLK